MDPRTLAQAIQREVMEAAGKGLNEATSFLARRIRETLDVPAPNPITPATAGAPPRKITGNLQNSIIVTPKNVHTAVVTVNARSAKGFPYGLYHERRTAAHPTGGRHPFVRPTVEKYKKELAEILVRTIRVTVR